MYGVDPWPGILWGLESGLVVLHAAHEGAHGEDLGELGAGVEGVGTEVCVYFLGGEEVG